MNEDENRNLQDYVTIREAADMLGLSYTTIHNYVVEGRIKSERRAHIILLPVDEVKNFKPNITGRPRTSIPLWRISPEENSLQETSITVQLRKGSRNIFMKRLDDIRQNKQHLFPGTIARYVIGSKKHPDKVKISLIWRISVIPDETAREEALEAFRQELADVVDWATAEYNDGIVYMHT